MSKNKRVSKDLRLPYITPIIKHTEMLSDYLPEIDEEKSTYGGFDKNGFFWIGRKSSYKHSSVLNENSQRVEVVTTDGKTDKEISRKFEMFNMFEFKQALTEGILHFAYKKVNGDTREAYGTTKVDILRKNGCRILFDRKKRNVNNIRYFDMNSKAWRSFKPANLMTIYEEID